MTRVASILRKPQQADGRCISIEIVSRRVVSLGQSPRLADRAGNVSAFRWHADDRIIAHRGDCLKGHVAGSRDGPFIVLLTQQRTDEAEDSVVIREDANGFCGALHLAIEPFDLACRMKLGPMLFGKRSWRRAGPAWCCP